MTLVDPCFVTEITLLPIPFVDATYVLRDAEQAQEWIGSEIYSVDESAGCGPLIVEFFNDD